MSARTAASFDGFPAGAFDWFRGLEADNSKQYFSAHRESYEAAVRGALQAMLEELANELGGSVKMFRQHRDVRFSRDKSPYKTRTYGVIAERPGGRPALYAQLSSEGLFAGTGYYMLAADQLARFRDGVLHDGSGPELERAVHSLEAAGVEVFGEALRTAPRGYPREHPRIELLRYKSLIAGRRSHPGPDGIGRAVALEHARRTWQACEPLNSWLERNVGASELPMPVRRR
jgi:uncharacterized protein (TIGR02453 family)